MVRDAQNVSVRTYAFRCSTRRVKRELFIAYTTSRMHSSQMTIKRLNKQKGLQDKQKKIFFFSSRLPTYTHYRDQEMGGQEVKLNEKKKNDVQSLHTQWGHRKDDFPCTNLGVFSQTVTTSQQVTASNTQETSRVDVRFSPTLTAHGARHPYLDSTSSFAGTPRRLSITTTTAGACARACERAVCFPGV